MGWSGPGLFVSLPHSGRWAPAAPAAPAAVARLDALDVGWDPPAAGGPAVSSYRLHYRLQGSFGPYRVIDTTAVSARVTGLVGGAAYELFVVASNSNGAGGASAVITAVALESPCVLDSVADQTAPGLVGDCEALWAQRRALTGATALTHAPNGAWDDQTPLSAWQGVTVTSGRVTAVDLSGLGVRGTVAADLGGLDALERLDLSANALSGPIPAELGGLAALEVLDVSLNTLSGPIPAQLGGLANLRVLDVSLNTLSGPIPAELGSLASVEVLDVAGNSLSGPVPAELGSLASLRVLRVSGQGLSGPIPAQLGSLGTLTELLIDGGALSGPIPVELAALSNLTSLHISGGALSGPIPSQLSTLTGHIPPQLADNTALQTLDLRDNPLTWPPPPALAEPRAGLTAILPDATWWAPPRPEDPTAEPGDTELAVTWQHPGAGSDFLVDRYTVNYRPQNHTGPYTQTTATTSPATISGLTNATTYDIFVTAANPRGTSAPSETITAAPTAAAGRGDTSDDTDPAGRGLTDAARAAIGNYLEILNSHGVLTGTDCTSTSLCPDSLINRWHTAVWIIRVLDEREPTATTSHFDDVPTSLWWNPHVKRFHDEGITAGCSTTPPKFCPYRNATRAQMAVFIATAFNIAPTTTSSFSDVPRGSFAHDQINAIHQAGITAGCATTPLRFCPDTTIPRTQAAVFIARAKCIRTPTYCESNGNGNGNGNGSDGPPAPTITKITPGPGTLTVTWTPDTSTPQSQRLGHQIRPLHTRPTQRDHPRDQNRTPAQPPAPKPRPTPSQASNSEPTTASA